VHSCIAALVVAISLVLSPRSSEGEPGGSWNGTWIGNWENGSGTQIVFAGDEFISIYWNGDYRADASAKSSNEKRIVSIAWTGGGAVMTREGAKTAHIVIYENGAKNAAFELRKDGE